MAKRQKKDSVVEQAAEHDVHNTRSGYYETIRGAELREGHEIVTRVNKVNDKVMSSYLVKKAVRCGRKSLSVHVNDQYCYDAAGFVNVRI